MTSYGAASKEPLEPNLRRFLRFVGVQDGDFVELVGMGRGNSVYIAGTRSLDEVVRLAMFGGLLKDRSGEPLEGLYLGLNKPSDACGSRYKLGEWHSGGKHVSSSEIEKRRALYIDLDPKRPSGTSASDLERAAAKAVAEAVYQRLGRLCGGAEALGLGSSGNGFQVYLAMNCPESKEVESAVKRIVDAVAVLHSTTNVDVDRKVVDAGRLAPAFGTLKCKGAAGETARPHRRSFFMCGDDVRRLNTAQLIQMAEQLEAALTPEQLEASRAKVPARSETTVEGGTLLSVANAHPVGAVAEWLGILQGDEITCPGCGEKGEVGKKGSVAILEKSNRLKCSHNRCADKGLGGSRTPIELVIEVRGLDRESKGVVPQAATEICAHFGLEYEAGKRVKKRGKRAKVEDGDANPVYQEAEGCLLLGDLQLANFTARIEREVVQDDGTTTTRKYSLTGKTSEGVELKAAEVLAKEFASMTWVAPSWGARARLSAGRNAWAHAAAGIQALSNPRVDHVYTHTGWRDLGRRVYLLPGGGISEDGIASVDCKPKGLERYTGPQTPGLDEALPALRQSLSILGVGPDEVTAPLVALVYLAPLASILDGVPFVTWVVGKSGGYKSSLAALAQAHWGPFDFNTLPMNWGATVNFLESQVSRSKDVMTVIDNYVPPQTGSEQQRMISAAVRLIQNIGDGQDRGRLDSNAEERERRRMMSAVVSTAELLPPDNTSTLGRCLVVEIENGALDLNKIRTVRQGLGLLPLALGGYVRWLARLDPAEVKATFEKMRDLVLAEWTAITAGGHNRIGDIVARLKTGVSLMLRYAETIGVLADERDALALRFDEAFKRVALAQPRPAQLTGVDQWLDALRTILMTHEAGLQQVTSADLEPDKADEGKRPVPLIGWVDGEQVLLSPAAAQRAVQRFLGSEWRYNPTELARQLTSASMALDSGETVKVLAAREGRHAAIKRRVGGQRQRVWALDRRVLGVLAGYAGPRAVNDGGDDEDDSFVELMQQV